MDSNIPVSMRLVYLVDVNFRDLILLFQLSEHDAHRSKVVEFKLFKDSVELVKCMSVTKICAMFGPYIK